MNAGAAVISGHAGDPNHHMTGQGKLDRIAQQARQNLPNAPGIADKAGGQKQIVIHQQRQPFVTRSGLQQQDDFVNAPFKVKRGRVQFQLVRFDLRVIQHIVDDHQQRLGRVADRVDIKLLFFVRLCFGK